MDFATAHVIATQVERISAIHQEILVAMFVQLLAILSIITAVAYHLIRYGRR